MTLNEYYENLPESTSPKSELIFSLVAKTGAREHTVRNWVKGRAVPADPKVRSVISETVGIPESELFKTEEAQ